jgi:UDP-2,3-diacylglucosamine pyrophosphatase LpxH
MGTINKSGNVLVIPDLHLPFQHEKAFDHCRRVRDKYKCSVVVDIGDMFDLHAINYHEKDLDDINLAKELDDVHKESRRWIRSFDTIYHVYGNHSSLVARKAVTAGLSKRMIKSLNEIFDLPKTWYWDDEWIKDDVKYCHGHGRTGKYSYADYARDNMQSTCIGHTHTTAGINWVASSYKLVWGMGVGCLIDRKSYAMAYAKELPKKPILGCGVVLERGTQPLFVPLEM